MALVYDENSESQEVESTHLFKVVRLLAALFAVWLFFPVSGGAQTAHPFRVAAKTNLPYLVLMSPNVGVEAAIGNRFTVSASGTYCWEGPWFDHFRVVVADLEFRYWTASGTNVQWDGLHVGPYAAVYRYDFLFGHKGQQAKINWGAGVNCGYTLPLDCNLSLDFSLSLGYVGGKYKEYERPDDGWNHNVWMADKKRHYVGPTKLEVSLLWHIGGTGAKAKKGGAR